MKDDLISKSELLTKLIHCKELTLGSFEALEKFLENYPTEVNMGNIKEQIKNKTAHWVFDEDGVLRIRDLMDILDKGGV